ncbi:alpha-galactosidase [Deminuibacter soli]|uniref:Alpha-galactosidase n=1 Tax=Deminuibacter soli TaxID=2291815 RepID=A0A3E1NH45_9BACT|nr:alpha-galactosidase [Deminuibacter soli]RFM27174.1 alpha-galactosidase [Deminuibacter soli]
MRLLLTALCMLYGASLFAQNKTISIDTKNSSLVFAVGKNERLYQVYFGRKTAGTDYTKFKTTHEAYIGGGLDDWFEPALRMVHNDGNPSLELHYQSHTSTGNADSIQTDIVLKDPAYPVEVVLHFTAFPNEDVIKAWSTISHNEKKPVVLSQYASALLHFDADQYWLTQFHGDWAKEMNMEESRLTNGIHIIDSKLGTRADFYRAPLFFLSLNQPSTENTGELIAGTLAWTGNFRFAFEIDRLNSLRVLPGINNYASDYTLQPGETFTTPAFIYTYSNAGKGQASRNLHKWARNYAVLDGNQPRLTLLNNWEATEMNFNENILSGLFDQTKQLGVDMFLLDDGWFGNNHPRNGDTAGLGDWQPNKAKLPNGIGHLVQEATAKGVKFGIWLEPEMVNPKSDLYNKHPDWILRLPNRQEHLERNQLVLDLTNPQVQDFVYHIVADLLDENKDIAYIKWDCNRPMTNTYSPYLKQQQSHLYIDYTRGLYKVFERVRAKYPHLPIMLCSGGGGRTDYGALKYFTEFWPSDNTDPLERIFIQWGYSYFFPANTIAAHVTNWGKQSLKFKTDVAMMDKLGYDIKVSDFTAKELQFSQQAIANYKRLSEVIWKGDLYRLVSPYDNQRAVVMYVNDDKTKAVLFNYHLYPRRAEVFYNVTLQGLDPNKQYHVKETNLFPGTQSHNAANDKVYSGAYLMNIGFNPSNGGTPEVLSSHVFEITAE